MVLECCNLTKRYNHKTAVDHINIQLEKGRIYALLGQNGSGKTTFMKMAAGLVKPDEGSITINGKAVGWNTKKEVAYMPTEPYFYDYMTVQDVGRYYSDFFDDFDRQRYDTLITTMGLSMDDKVKHISSGLLCKLKLTATLSRNTSLYLLDEPLNGIDIITREIVVTSIIEAAKEDNTILISSHLIDELEQVVDHVIFLENGAVKLISDAEELREVKRKSIVEAYKDILA